ncbi:hemerythrin domain-containing protein [Undibacterium sp. TJN19]|uniref:hemerythrin domain-containing protein n=1 Tax=Undibacterium sp. TJN19 TaxID=3413055 RepID=UPI003BF2F36D
MNNLIDSAPGFDQPLAVLKHCHDRIRKQLATLAKLSAHLPAHGADAEAQQAAQAVLRYFSKAAPLHHEDEEVNLLPELSLIARAEDAVLLAQLMPQILSQHEEMATQWQAIESQLLGIVNAGTGTPASLSGEDIQAFTALYDAHMQTEETQIAPMAKRLFSPTQMAAFGAAMQARRGIENT